MKLVLLNQYRTSVQHTLYSTIKDDRHAPMGVVDNFTPRECTTPEGTAVVRDINTDQLLFLPKRRLIQLILMIGPFGEGYELTTDAHLVPMSRRHEFQRYRWDDSESSYTFYKKK